MNSIQWLLGHLKIPILTYFWQHKSVLSKFFDSFQSWGCFRVAILIFQNFSFKVLFRLTTPILYNPLIIFRILLLYKKNPKWLITFYEDYRAKVQIFEKPLKNGYNNMCLMLMFVKSKNNYFSIFSDELFELFKNSTLYTNR